MSALDTQVGGDHYRAGSIQPIQPIQYIEANSLQFLEASVVKRVTRHNRPTGKGRQDIEKAIHELQLLLELRYAEQVTAVMDERASDYCLPEVKHPLPLPPVAAPAKVQGAKPGDCPRCGQFGGHGPEGCPIARTATDVARDALQMKNQRVTPVADTTKLCIARDCFAHRSHGNFCSSHWADVDSRK